jgi:hypothetical protein
MVKVKAVLSIALRGPRRVLLIHLAGFLDG